MSAREPIDFDRPIAGQPIFIDIDEVISRVGIGRTKIYDLILSGAFPRQVKVGSASYWDLGEIIQWQRSHLAARYLLPTSAASGEGRVR